MDVLSLFLSRPMNVDVNGLTRQHTRIRDLATRTRWTLPSLVRLGRQEHGENVGAFGKGFGKHLCGNTLQFSSCASSSHSNTILHICLNSRVISAILYGNQYEEQHDWMPSSRREVAQQPEFQPDSYIDHDGFPQTKLVVFTAISRLTLYVNHHAVVIVSSSCTFFCSCSSSKIIFIISIHNPRIPWM